MLRGSLLSLLNLALIFKRILIIIDYRILLEHLHIDTIHIIVCKYVDPLITSQRLHFLRANWIVLIILALNLWLNMLKGNLFVIVCLILIEIAFIFSQIILNCTPAMQKQ